MSTRLIILGLLQEEGPMHGYEVKQRIKHEHMEEYADISYGAIYFALNKLANESFIEKIATKQKGKRPPHDIYQITDKGRDEFLRLLRESLTVVEKEVIPLMVGIRFMGALPHEELREYLIQRKEVFERELQELERTRTQVVKQHYHEHYTEIIKAFFDYFATRLQAELKWLQSVLDKLEKGLLP